MRKPRLFFILYLIFVLLIARAMIFVLYLFIHTESMAPHRGSSWHRLNKSLIQDAISIDPMAFSGPGIPKIQSAPRRDSSGCDGTIECAPCLDASSCAFQRDVSDGMDTPSLDTHTQWISHSA